MQEYTQANKNVALDAIQGMGRSLAFPDVWQFGELFETIEPHSGGPSHVLETFPSWDADDEPCRVRDYCGVAQGESLRVRPTQAVLDFLKGRFGVPGSDITFHVVVRDDGSALVTARVSHIISGAWLALVPAQTVPHQEYSAPEARALGGELFR